VAGRDHILGTGILYVLDTELTKDNSPISLSFFIILLEYLLVKLVRAHFLAKTALAADDLVLTEYTLQRAAREEYRARAASAADGRLFEMVRCNSGNSQSLALAAKSVCGGTVNITFSRTDIADHFAPRDVFIAIFYHNFVTFSSLLRK
jgi:hypothetical protein